MINYCEKCKEYGLKSVCKRCSSRTIVKKPARFSLERNYSKERLKVKGLL